MDAETLRTLIDYFNIREFLRDNSPLRLAIILGIVCLMLIAAEFICSLIQKKIDKYFSGKPSSQTAKSDSPDKKALAIVDGALLKKVIKSIKLVLYCLILYWGFDRLVIGPVYTSVLKIIFICLFIWTAIKFLTACVSFNIDLYLRRHGSTLKTSQSRSLMPIINGIIWAIGLTFLLDNLGFHISTIIAGLGIAGVAVGLAGQAILADFFSYIVILLDKPFRIGDYVILNENRAGDVEYMGPKTTHLRALNGDLIVCANSEMTKGILVNQGNIHERKVDLTIGVAYETPKKILNKLPDILKDVINSFPQCSFERACLINFGASNLQFQLLYKIKDPHGNVREYMNTKSQVNTAILEKFNAESISMAYQTEHILLTDLPFKPQMEDQPAASDHT